MIQSIKTGFEVFWTQNMAEKYRFSAKRSLMFHLSPMGRQIASLSETYTFSRNESTLGYLNLPVHSENDLNPKTYHKQTSKSKNNLKADVSEIVQRRRSDEQASFIIILSFPS